MGVVIDLKEKQKEYLRNKHTINGVLTSEGVSSIITLDLLYNYKRRQVN